MNNNYDAQFSVLSCLLQDPSLHELGAVKADDFTDQVCLKVYLLLEKYYLDGKTPDGSVLALCSENETLLQDILKLKDFVAVPSFWRDYVRELKAQTICRKKDSLAHTMSELSLDEIQAEIDKMYLEQCVDDRPLGVQNLISRYKDFISSPETSETFPSDIHSLDTMQILKRKRLIILGALTNIGKSALAMNIAVASAVAKKKVLFVTMEMSAEDMMERMVSFFSGQSHPTAEERDLALQSISEMSDFRLIEAMGKTSQELYSIAIREQNQNGVDMIIVDYIQKLTDQPIRGETSAAVMNRIMSRLFDLGLKTNSVVIAVSQFNREANIGTKIPSMSQFKESSAIEQAASAVMILHRENINSADAILRIAKNRHGRVGDIQLKFDREITKFYEPNAKN